MKANNPEGLTVVVLGTIETEGVTNAHREMRCDILFEGQKTVI